MLRQAGKQPRPIPPMNDYNIIKAKGCEVSREPRSMQKLCGTGAGQSVPHCPALSRDVRFCRESSGLIHGGMHHSDIPRWECKILDGAFFFPSGASIHN